MVRLADEGHLGSWRDEVELDPVNLAINERCHYTIWKCATGGIAIPDRGPEDILGALH